MGRIVAVAAAVRGIVRVRADAVHRWSPGRGTDPTVRVFVLG